MFYAEHLIEPSQQLYEARVTISLVLHTGML